MGSPLFEPCPRCSRGNHSYHVDARGAHHFRCRCGEKWVRVVSSTRSDFRDEEITEPCASRVDVTYGDQPQGVLDKLLELAAAPTPNLDVITVEMNKAVDEALSKPAPYTDVGRTLIENNLRRQLERMGAENIRFRWHENGVVDCTYDAPIESISARTVPASRICAHCSDPIGGEPCPEHG